MKVSPINFFYVPWANLSHCSTSVLSLRVWLQLSPQIRKYLASNIFLQTQMAFPPQFLFRILLCFVRVRNDETRWIIAAASRRRIVEKPGSSPRALDSGGAAVASVVAVDERRARASDGGFRTFFIFSFRNSLSFELKWGMRSYFDA